MVKKTIILTDERCGGTSLTYLINSMYSNYYSGLDDIHTHFLTLKNNENHWIKDVFNISRKNQMFDNYDNNLNYLSEFFSKFSNKNELIDNYFELIDFLFSNGINTYKLSITNLKEDKLIKLLQKLKNLDSNIIILKRKNIYGKIYSKVYASSYNLLTGEMQGYDIINTIKKINVNEIVINCAINQEKKFQELLKIVNDYFKNNNNVYNLLYEDIYNDIQYFKTFLNNFKNINNLNILNHKLFVESYFKDYKTSTNKVILNEQLLKNLFDKNF